MKMSKSMIGVLVVVGLVVMFGLYVASSVYSTKSYCVNTEEKIIAHYDDMKNVLS